MGHARIARAWHTAQQWSLPMIAGTAVALIWANVDYASYARVTGPWHFAVNDVAMVFFFGLAVKEIVEATAPGGALHSPRRAALPVVAAVGGMVGPALLFVALASWLDRPDLQRGWAIPCATDIAFSVLVIRRLVPSTSPAIPFLLLLAIADDALGLVLLGTLYPSALVRPLVLVGLVGMACGVAWTLRRQRVDNFWPYVLVSGGLSWAGLYLGGLHPALALVPVLPFVPHAARDQGWLVETDDRDPLSAFARWWKGPVEIVLFAFALTNAGVPIGRLGDATWIVLTALIVGKPGGILGGSWLAVRAGLRRPDGLAWSDILVLGCVAGIGFTVALFFATAAFPSSATLGEVKLGALFSVSAAIPAFILARWFRAASARRP